MSLAPWQTLSARTLLEIPGRIRVEVEAVKLPDGRVVDDYLQVRMPGFALVFATTTHGKIICISQYKHGPRRVSLTLPAGHVEEGEDSMQAAQRELLEETGFRAERYELLGSFVVNGNQGAGTAHVVRGHECRLIAPPKPSDLEYMDVQLRSYSNLREALFGGEVAIASHAAAIGMGLLLKS